MYHEITIEEAANTLQKAGLKVSRISGTGQLRTEFPRGYYVSIGEHVARELADHIKRNPQIDADRISEYFRARIFYGPAVANAMLQPVGKTVRRPA
ncbi:MAG: hypothetical protein IMW93_01145 [Thermoanaerobacteraceae bacterium]|uniref:Uncharacterized protein n=1 Tax=Desulfofundulus thermobenzoicus TaxID=29376 RepID=A0A6N7IP98_9FIRM|nr:hypothetical protein [Desulfofundulus thermobenzoicus]MBE3587163.1 hypothetical protein [Thermoanaerobacteraceae bacterium]MQL51780.1 hypothetical protein [Desulfofundulus thermobenzoicus]HHW44957.1 hypothetical protein [Desulfotomaculum sp.]